MRTYYCDSELDIRMGGRAIQFWDVTDRDVSREGLIFASFCAGASASPTENKVLAAFPCLVISLNLQGELYKGQDLGVTMDLLDT